MAKVKLGSGIIKPFNGEGDVVAWLTKVELVARLQKVDDVASFLPLFLEGDALQLYLEMDEDHQTNIALIKSRLKEAFSDGEFSAYTKLKMIRWTGESVDVYASKIRQLAGRAGFSGHGLETVMKLAFVTGFPNDISKELKQVPVIEKLTMGELLIRARVLTKDTTEDTVATTSFPQRGNRTRNLLIRSQTSSWNRTRFSITLVMLSQICC